MKNIDMLSQNNYTRGLKPKLKNSLILMLCMTIVFVLFSTINLPTKGYSEGTNVYIDYDITANTTWTKGNNYIICYKAGTNSEVPSVKPGVTLTIDEGVKVILGYSAPKAYPGGKEYRPQCDFKIEGTINATNVLFTSLVVGENEYKFGKLLFGKDNPFNGNFQNCTFENGGEGSTAYGMVQIEMDNYDDSNFNLIFNNCTFKNANNDGIFCHANGAGNISITNSTFDNVYHAVQIGKDGSDEINVSIDNCTFSNSKDRTGVVIQNGKDISVTNSIFSGNGNSEYGVSLHLGYDYNYANIFPRGEIIVNNNTFTKKDGTTGHPIEVYAGCKINSGAGPYTNTYNDYSDDYSFIRIFKDIGFSDAVWGELGLPYYLNLQIDIGSRSTNAHIRGSLLIKPGITVTMGSKGQINANATFNASGTQEKPITFNALPNATEKNKIDIGYCRGNFTAKHCVFDGLYYGIFGEYINEIQNFLVEDSIFKNMCKGGASIFLNQNEIQEGKLIIRRSLFENNGEHGLYARGNPYANCANRLAVYNSIFRNNKGNGVKLENLTELKLENCLIYSNVDNGIHVSNKYNTPETASSIINCTIAKNHKYGLYNIGSQNCVIVKNTIISDNNHGDLYNGRSVTGSNITYSCITDSYSYDNPDNPVVLGEGSIRKDPLFVNRDLFNFHLKPHSQCIDAGDPKSEYSNEPTPNCELINMGYYGNTSDATPTPIPPETLDTINPTWNEGALITATNLTKTGASLTWTEATDNIGVTGYKVYYRNIYNYPWILIGIVDSNTFSFNVTEDIINLNQGTRFKVEAIDGGGNITDNGPQKVVINEDDMPPLWHINEGNFPKTYLYEMKLETTSTSTEISWEGAWEPLSNEPIYKYKIFKDGIGIAEIEGTIKKYTVSGLSPNTSYTFKVEAGDSSGNWTTDGPSCTMKTKDDDPAIVPSTSVELNKNTIELDINKEEILIVTVKPENATNKDVTWLSSNELVATVDTKGKIKAIGVGTATITVKTNDGNRTATCTVKVKKPTLPDPTPTPTPTPTLTPSDTPIYNASLTGDAGKSIDIKIEVDEKSNTARTKMNSEQARKIFSSKEDQVITIPSIDGVDYYMLDLPGDSLDSAQKKNELTLATDIGSMVIPSNMLSNIDNLDRKVASITIGQVDKSSLSQEIKAKVGNRPIIQISLNIDGEKVYWNNPNASVKVSIPYSPTIDELKNPEQIVIWYIDGSGNPVSIPNGRYYGASGNVIFTTNHFSYYAVNFNKIKFNDVAENAWYKTPVGFIAAREITTGTGNGKFSPELKLTRGQFIVMMMKAYDIVPSGNLDNNFIDSGNTYYTDYLGEAKRIGIAAGVGNNMFLPEREISRQEMFTILYRALKEIDQLPEEKSNSKLEDFTDLAQIDSWAKDAIKLLVESNIIKGSNGKLKPLDLTSRAEMAQILYNLLSK